LRILYRYRTVFAKDVSEIKLAKGPPLKIDLHTNRKMYKRKFNLNETDKIEMARQLKVMHEADIIESSETHWYNAPAFMVWKDRSKRLVVDLKGINSLIIPKAAVLPHIEEVIDTITSKKPRYLSILDITSAFFQLAISEESRDYTGFTGPDGK